MERDPEAPYKPDLFLDKDGDMFFHVLQYLRSGVLPGFMTSGWGYDHEWQLLESQARDLGIEGLLKAVKEKKAETERGWASPAHSESGLEYGQDEDPNPDNLPQ